MGVNSFLWQLVHNEEHETLRWNSVDRISNSRGSLSFWISRPTSRWRVALFFGIHKSRIYTFLQKNWTYLTSQKNHFQCILHKMYQVCTSHLCKLLRTDYMLKDLRLQQMNAKTHSAQWMRDDQCSTAHNQTTLFICSGCCQHWSNVPTLPVRCFTVSSPLKCELSCGISITCDGAALSLCRSRIYFWNAKDRSVKPRLGRRQLTDLEGSSVCSFSLVFAGGFQDGDWRRIFFLHGYICWNGPPWDSVWCENSRLYRCE